MEKVTDIKTKLTELRKEYKEACKTQGKDFVKALTKDLFKAIPGARAVKWAQYTPYFNDGDSCTFGVREAYIDYGDDEEAGEGEDGWLCSYDLKGGQRKALEAFDERISEFDDLLEEVFGDHVEVTCSADGKSETEEYSHD